MVGIYKITNPNGHIYIGQSINQANINIICNEKGKTYKGFIWKFKI